MLRVVVDTDVLVAGFLSPDGASRQLLIGAFDKQFSLLVSTALILEYEAVLCRPQHLQQAKARTADVIELLDAIAGICSPVLFDYRWRPSGAEADDELVMETAINGQADAIVTFNLKHMSATASRFGLLALRPKDFLERLRQ